MTPPADDFIDAEQPVTSTDLAEVERSLDFIFPPQFRSHYLTHNGGSPRRCLFHGKETIHVVNQFLPIKYGRKDYRFEDVYRDLKVERGILPKHLVAFADDPGGDFYCFSVRDQDAGSIWLYIGEYGDEPKRASKFLAPSLADFLAGLREDKE